MTNCKIIAHKSIYTVFKKLLIIECIWFFRKTDYEQTILNVLNQIKRLVIVENKHEDHNQKIEKNVLFPGKTLDFLNNKTQVLKPVTTYLILPPM